MALPIVFGPQPGPFIPLSYLDQDFNYLAGLANVLFVSVKDAQFGAVGDGIANDYAAFVSAINYVSAKNGGIVFVPAGNYNMFGNTLALKNGVRLVGEGYGYYNGSTAMPVSRVFSACVTDFITLTNPINSSTLANASLEYLYIEALSLNPYNGCVSDLGSSKIAVIGCFLNSNQVCLILDQTESSLFENVYFGGSTAAAGVWMVNGPDKHPGSNPYFTNQLTFKDCLFNVAGIQIVDDGGNSHLFIGCNINQGTQSYRACTIRGTLFQGCEIEGATDTAHGHMWITNTLWKSGNPSGNSTNLTITTCTIFNGVLGTPVPVITIDSGSINTMEFTNIDMDTRGHVLVGTNNLANLVAFNNYQFGAGDGYTLINNYYGAQTFTPAWTADGAAPSVGNGSLTALVSRAGREITVHYSLIGGTTTSWGTGNWHMSLPALPLSSYNGHGAAFYDSPTVAFYCGTARVDGMSALVTFFAATNTTTAVTNTVPFAWATGGATGNGAGTFLEATVSYTSSNNIG